MNRTYIKEVEAYIHHFYEYVMAFNQVLIDTYKLDCEPTYNEAGRLFPRNGTVSSGGISYNYRYHGSGCTVVVNEVILNYNIDVSNNNEINITAWKINEFIRTYSKGLSEVHIRELDEIFLELEKQETLIRRDKDSLVFNINTEYFSGKTPYSALYPC